MDLEARKIIRGQKYKMLIVVYSREELENIENMMDNIEDGNKVMFSLYGDIYEIQVRAKAQILEVDKFYSVANMEIFIDNSMDELASTKTLV